MFDPPASKTPREIERELVAEMDRARREYEQAARDYQRVMESRTKSSIPSPDNSLDIQNLGKIMTVRYQQYREALLRFKDFVCAAETKARATAAGEGKGPQP